MMKSIITCFMAAFLSLSFNQVILAQETPSAQESVEYRLPTYQLPPKDGTIQPLNWNITPAGITGIQAPQQKAAVLSAFPGQVMKVRVLCVIYTNTAGGTTTAGEISQLKAEVEEARMFYWRNSHGRCYLEVTYMIIDEYKELDEFWNLWGGYWMTFWDTDGDGRSVEQDLRNRGVTNNMYSGVVNFYAWGENGHPAALGGGAYGVDVGFLGQTAYCAIPHCWDPTTNDWFFIHEFHHELDSMFHYSGFPEYPHADLPIELPGDFGEGYDFNAFIMRTWPINKWMSLASPWGSIMSVTDADLDGLADEGTHLPLTEVTLNSSPAMVDTDGDGLTDLAEAMGGILRSAIAFDTDTDNDGLIDGLDKYPIYAIDEFTPRGTRTIDGNLEPAWHHLGSPLTINNAKLSASIKTNWDSNYLYLAFQTGRYCKPRIYLDAGNDGWFHGKDNYEIIINPNRSVGSQVEVAHIWDCS
ncbi:MAG TPA: hypothetical protein PLZ21_10875, partial [Armatimonadota bacterium]|nr:hypothetical protein [Armatimonadota bacterium]